MTTSEETEMANLLSEASLRHELTKEQIPLFLAMRTATMALEEKSKVMTMTDKQLRDKIMETSDKISDLVIAGDASEVEKLLHEIADVSSEYKKVDLVFLSVIVLLKNPNEHNYPLGEPVLVTDTHEDRALIPSQWKLGNRIPLTMSCIRPGTEAEIAQVARSMKDKSFVCDGRCRGSSGGLGALLGGMMGGPEDE